MPTDIRIKVRRDSTARWLMEEAKGKLLSVGEIIYDTTENRLKIGMGGSFSETPYLEDDDTIYIHPEYPAQTGKPTGNETPAFGASFTVSQITSDATGHITNATNRTITIPNAAATTSAAGLMSAADKTKLDGIATGATKYTHPSYTARTGQPTGNATPAFGGSFTVSQITSDATGHVTGATDRTITIPSTVATTSAAGLMSAADKKKVNALPSSPTTEAWTFTLSDGSTVTRTVVLG